MLIIDQLKTYKALSEAEKSVANKLIELQNKIEDMSIRELAKSAFVSTSAVSRLCDKLGFNGFNDFKKKFLDEIKYENACFIDVDANFPFKKDDNLAKVVTSISELYKHTSEDTLSLVDYYELIKAVKLIKEAKNVYVICIGSSIEIGQIFAERMLRIGKSIVATDNVNMQYYYSRQSSPEDCFIVISYSGTTLKTTQDIEAIYQNKAKLILVTSVGHNKLKEKADVILTMTTRERLYTNIAPYTSTISTMIIFDMLYSAYFHTDYDYHLEYKREVAKAYEPNRKASQSIMEENENAVFTPRERRTL